MEGDTFENLEVWKEAVDLAAGIYAGFRHCGDREFRSQVQGAALSISSNIAEGYERTSNTEFIRFLDFARGSCGEVRSQLRVAVRVQLLSAEAASSLLINARRLSKRIARLMIVRRQDFA